MKYKLPTMHTLYFGIRAKKDKVDAAGDTKGSNKNIAEIYQQVLMMLGHEIFDQSTADGSLRELRLFQRSRDEPIGEY